MVVAFASALSAVTAARTTTRSKSLSAIHHGIPTRCAAITVTTRGPRPPGSHSSSSRRQPAVAVAWVGRGSVQNDLIVLARARLFGLPIRTVSCDPSPSLSADRLYVPPAISQEDEIRRYCRRVGAVALVYGGVREMNHRMRLLLPGVMLQWVRANSRTRPWFPAGVPGSSVLAASGDARAAIVAAAVLISEDIGNDVRVDYRNDDNGNLRGGTPDDRRSLPEKISDTLQGVYLPAGYPQSVTADYLAFTKWRVLQNLASSIMGVVSTEALLFGLGLGKTATAATAAATAWVLKDGLGYIGKVAYGYAVGKQFDHDPKSWRVCSDTVEDLGGVLEILTPVFPGNFLLLASLANTLKGVAAMTGTATRHAIYKSLALQENQGDIATKGESQGVTCKMIGLGLGIAVSSAIGQNYQVLLAAYSGFAAVHLAANWKSMQCVQFATLNRQRSSIVIDAFLKGEALPNPYEASHKEKMILTPWRGYQPNIALGCKVHSAVKTEDDLRRALRSYRKENFFIVSESNDGGAETSRRTNQKMFIVLRENASSQDVLKAFFASQIYMKGQYGDLLESKKLADSSFSSFLKAAKRAGWSTEHVLLNPGRARASW